ncbi:MAG: Rieske (2Fe-2S) protein [Pseudohongiellaceae bacterium]
MPKESILSRRALCKLGLASSLAIPLKIKAQTANNMRPQPGDLLVFDEGDRKDQVITPALLVLNAQPVPAFAQDPVSGDLRDGSRLNRVMVMRAHPADLNAATRRNAADGIIAYSAVCTHTGCDVTNWNADSLLMACPCHESQFDVRNSGRVTGGPAPRPLVMLPLVIENDQLKVARAFTGRVGFQQDF